MRDFPGNDTEKSENGPKCSKHLDLSRNPGTVAYLPQSGCHTPQMKSLLDALDGGLKYLIKALTSSSSIL